MEIEEGDINKVVQQTLSEEQQLEVENDLIEQAEDIVKLTDIVEGKRL